MQIAISFDNTDANANIILERNLYIRQNTFSKKMRDLETRLK